MSDIIVRQADINDVNGIYQIETLCFPDPWTVESLETEFTKNKHAFYLVAELDGKIVGFAGLWWIFDEGHITNVAVHPDFRKCHIGQSMMLIMLDHTISQGMMHHTLEVRVSNEAAIAMYEKLGFQVEGRREKYYSDNGEDALLMWRHASEEEIADKLGGTHEG